MKLDNSLYFTEDNVINFLLKQGIHYSGVEAKGCTNLDNAFNITRYYLITTADKSLAIDKLRVYHLGNDISSAKVDVELSKVWRAYVYQTLAKIDASFVEENIPSENFAGQYKKMFEISKSARIASAEQELKDIKKDEF